MPNVRASSGTIGTISLPISGCFISVFRTLTKAAVVEASRPREPASASWNVSSGGALISIGFTLRAGSEPPMASMRAFRYCISGESSGGRKKLDVLDDFIGERNLEAVAELDQIGLAQLLLLMRGIAAFGDLAQPVALHRFGQDHGRLAVGLHGALVGVVNLHRIVAAAAQGPDLVVGQMLDQLQQLRIFAEKFFADIGAVMRAEGLVFAVDALVHALEQEAGGIAREQIVPAARPRSL